MKAKKLKQLLIDGIAAVALTLGGATAASAASYDKYPPEGGNWKHGTYTNGGTRWTAYSDYYHGSRTHQSVAWWTGQSKTWTAKTAKSKWAKDAEQGSTAGKAGYAVN